MRDEREHRLAALDLLKQNLENKWFYCCKKKVNVLVVRVEANKDTLYIKGKPVRCEIAWAIRKYTIRIRTVLIGIVCKHYYLYI